VERVARSIVRAAAGVLAIAALTGCGGDDADLTLSPEAEAGRSITRSNGCAACHGSAGEGGVGPAFAGLYGSEVELDDGQTAIADEAYLTESIRDPNAKRRAGYELAMPANELSDEEISSVIAYIRELSTGAASP
jgi:cytochrome c oxidase subunit II